MKTTQTNANLCPTLGAVLWTEKMDDFCLWLYARVILACTRINDYNSPLWNWRIAFSWIWFSQVLFQLLPTLSLVLLYGSRYTATLSRTCFWNRAKKPMLEGNAWITVHFHSPAFQKQTRRLTQTNTTAEGFSFSLHKNYKLGPTYPWLVLNFFSGRITSKESVCFEGWNKFSVPIWSPRKPNLTYRRRRRQLGLLSIKFDFRNVIFQ